MVVFTCQHCNASLKRVAVSKHYATVCRRNPYLTCIDCLKDFHGNDYDAHMTCVTEDERYGDKNYKAKPTGVKQKSWIDVVHSCANLNKDKKYKELFAKLVTYENVPRKKNKFMNFVMSSLPRYPQELANEVFDFIEVEFSKQKTPACNKENDESKTENHPNGTSSESKLEDEAVKTKKKKKNKNSDTDTVTSPTNGETLHAKNNVTSLENGETFHEKKKSKKINALTQDESMTSEDADNAKIKNKKGNLKKLNNSDGEIKVNLQNNHDINLDPEKKLSKKQLKKLKKQQKYEAELKNIAESKEDECEINVNGNGIEGEGEEGGKVSKKLKKRKALISESEADTGKKQKIEDEVDIGKDGEEEEAELKSFGKVKFNWEDTIKEILQKSPDHEMPIKRISKKVLAEYQAVKGNRESYEQLISKFNKKINKTNGVKVLKDKAKLISVDE